MSDDIMASSVNNGGIVYLSGVPNAMTIEQALHFVRSIEMSINKAKQSCVDCDRKTSEHPISGGERCSWGDSIVLCDDCYFKRLHEYGECDDD